MPHPLVIVHGRDWSKFLKYIKETIALLAFSDGLDVASVDALVKKYLGEIEVNREDIFLATAGDIVRYLNFYKVFPTEGVHDEFKGIYFTGMAVSRRLDHLGLVDLNKFHLRAMLRLLDFRLAEPYKANRTQLTQRIRSVIDNNVLGEHLGKYGWYLIYKCLYNAANERSKTI
jgi:hypothetical protein